MMSYTSCIGAVLVGRGADGSAEEIHARGDGASLDGA